MSDVRRRLGSALWRLSDLVRADEGRRSFRAKAYRNAVWSLDDLSPDLSEPREVMTRIPGIGAGVARVVEEYRDTGRVAALDRLAGVYPADVDRLRRLPRMTPAMLRLIKLELGVERLEDLVEVIDSGEIEEVRGVGPAIAGRWRSVVEVAPRGGALPAHQGHLLAVQLGRHLERHLPVTAWPAGEVRRVTEWVSSVDFVVMTADPDEVSVFLDDTAIAARSEVAPGTDPRLVLHQGTPVRVGVTDEPGVGAALISATGPPEHAAAVLDGWSGSATTEVEVYGAVGLPWVPPPARGLPMGRATAVVQTDDIRGDLHLHSDWSPDGRMSLFEICGEAARSGYEYILITDHTAGLRFGGMDSDAIRRQAESIEEVRAEFPGLLVLHGAELNVEIDGSLDIDDDGLDILDMAVLGLHSRFDLTRARQTRRVITALSHPVVKVLAHPTGRRIGTRPPVDIDIDAVVDAAVAHGVALEANGHRDRLDLSAELSARAVARGALTAANSDAHRRGEMANIVNAVASLQGGGVGASSVVNAWPREQFLDWASGVRAHG